MAKTDWALPPPDWPSRKIFGMAAQDLTAPRPAMCRECLDWSMRKIHLAGRLRRARLAQIETSGWLIRQPTSRAIPFARPYTSRIKDKLPLPAHFRQISLALGLTPRPIPRRSHKSNSDAAPPSGVFAVYTKEYPMSRVCELSGKGPMSGNTVSHANNKTRRRFLPNLNDVTLISDALGQSFKLKISAHALRTVDHRGGLDAFLAKSKDDELSPKALKIKKEVAKAAAV